MTEYLDDFSPAASKRHLETQARIARWTQSTHELPQKDPHTPPTPAHPRVRCRRHPICVRTHRAMLGRKWK
ncbi:hypothetical protein B0H17DRAFT_1212592 [Mycena rosella]|uniref:Uncharacterized protein n=1 Tax=Mycena rosella TaxID=1033263 RepID=A0AAD7CRQ8_MYCRO|nr:hypothetical protein B0H17DRAFT_1212592 [Mycena rosella]